jgi:hypothetical protein
MLAPLLPAHVCCLFVPHFPHLLEPGAVAYLLWCLFIPNAVSVKQEPVQVTNSDVVGRPNQPDVGTCVGGYAMRQGPQHALQVI